MAVRFGRCGLLLVAAVASSAVSVRSSQKVTPVEKVIELLTKLEAEVQKEGEKEAADYDKFACFCKEQADNKLYAIEKSKAKLEKLAAEISELEAEIADLNNQISSLAKRIAELDAEVKAATAVRGKEHEAYMVNAADVDGAIKAILGAIKALKDSKAQMTDAKTDLIQLRDVAAHVLQAIQRSPARKDTGSQVHLVHVLLQLQQPGQPAAYTYHSNDIIATLEALLKQFKEDKKEIDENEFKLRAAFEKNLLNLENEKKFSEQDKAEAEELASEKEALLNKAKEDEAAEQAAKAADEAFLSELTETCETKANEFDQRSSTRAAELTAIAEAIRTLEAGVKPNYSANKKLVDLQWSSKARIPVNAAVSFLQGSATARASAPSRRVLELLASTAQRLQSPLLSALAVKVQVQVSEDHFVKVRGLIKDLLAKLEADAEAEAETKSFCDTEMKAAIDARDQANSKLEELAASISSKESKKAVLEEGIAELSAAIADLTKALKEATELRAEERATNEKTIADAIEGRNAVEFAMNILQDFYTGAASLLQGKYVPPNADREGNTVSDLAPEVFEGKYEGKQDAAKGIMGLLEVILSDFERTIDAVGSAEKEAQADFEKFETDTKADIEAKEADKKEQETQVATLIDELAGLKDEEIDTKSVLESSLTELEKLKTMCVEGEETWEERKAKREQEVEALKEALVILDNWQS